MLSADRLQFLFFSPHLEVGSPLLHTFSCLPRPSADETHLITKSILGECIKLGGETKNPQNCELIRWVNLVSKKRLPRSLYKMCFS